MNENFSLKSRGRRPIKLYLTLLSFLSNFYSINDVILVGREINNGFGIATQLLVYLSVRHSTLHTFLYYVRIMRVTELFRIHTCDYA